MNDEPVRPTRPAPTPEPRKPTRPAPIANALTSVAQAVAGVVATIADAVVGDEWAPTAVSSTADAVAVYFGESMTTESEEDSKAIVDYVRRERDKLEEKQRMQRPDWAKFMVDNDMRITLNEYVDAENWAIEDFRDRHGDYPEEDDPEFQRMVLARARWIMYMADSGDNVTYNVFTEAFNHAAKMYEEEYGGEGDLDDSAFFQYVSDYVDLAMGK